MAITEVTTAGKNCTFTCGTTAYTATAFVNWDEFSSGLSVETRPFTPASSGISRFTMPRENIVAVRVRIRLGLAQTFLDIRTNFYMQTITAFTMTDWPAHATMVSQYGALTCTSVNRVQGEENMGDLVFTYGAVTTGYSAVV